MEQKEKGSTRIHESSHFHPWEFHHQPKGQMRSAWTGQGLYLSFLVHETLFLINQLTQSQRLAGPNLLSTYGISLTPQTRGLDQLVIVREAECFIWNCSTWLWKVWKQKEQEWFWEGWCRRKYSVCVRSRQPMGYSWLWITLFACNSQALCHVIPLFWFYLVIV